MADVTYQPKVYRDNNGDRMTIKAGGELVIEGIVRGLIPGTSYFVKATGGADTNDGLSWASAFATIQKAIDTCATAVGDRIFVAPGTYVENLTIAKSKVSIYAAVPTGNAKRVGVAPASGIALDVQTGALSLSVFGLRFVGVGALGYGMQLGADGCRFEECDFTADTSHGGHLQSRSAEESNTGSGAHFERCLFRECGGKGIQTGADTGSFDFHATNVNIIDCQFYTNTDDDIGDAEQASATYFYQWLVKGNHFSTKAKSPYLDLDGSTNNGLDLLVAGNWFAADVDTTAIKMPGTHGRAAANYGTDGVVGGVPVP